MFGTSVPDQTGLYAVQGDGRYLKLNGTPEWERETWAQRAGLDREVRFVVVHPVLAEGSSSARVKVRLLKVGWVRSEISPNGDIGPIRGPQWVAADIDEFEIPLRFARIDGTERAVEAIPREGALRRGLYSLQVHTGLAPLKGRFGVDWPNVDHNHYAAANCLDRYSGAEVSYRPCAHQQLATLGRGLRVYLVEPDRTVVNGKSVLVLKGTVVNVSEEPRRIPMLEAVLRSKEGDTLHRWRFPPPVEGLSPGESTAFRAVTRKVPPGTAKAVVTFASFAPVSSTVAGN